ncbi:MAG: HDOD domain-containing protein [Myxococcales bacterium]|nr:HDOD domain-containing protein [Myxococcales bacterium]
MQHSLTDHSVEAAWFGEEDPEAAREKAAGSEAAMRALTAGVRAPSAVVQKVLRICTDPSSSMGELRSAIEVDGALSAQLVRVANSAAFATLSPARSLDDAVLRLGVRRVRGIVTGLAALGVFQRETSYAAQIRAHSARVAGLVETLGREWRRRSAADLFLCGLVHDIGKLVLIEQGALDYPEGELGADHAHLLEREQLGFDHAALGRVLMEAWAFPADLVEVVDLHHDVARAYEVGGEVGASVALLRLADHIDDALEDGDPERWSTLARSGECSYLQISVDVFEASRPRLDEVRRDAASVLG